MARFLAAVAPHNGDWLLALPVSSCGLRLADDAVRVAVALRLGCSACIARTCRCGALAYAQGLHDLVCKQAPSKTTMYQGTNDVIARAATSAAISVTKEPVRLSALQDMTASGLTA